MSETVMIVTAICRTEECPAAGFQNVYERETGIDFVVHCGQCQNIIEDISTKPKE